MSHTIASVDVTEHRVTLTCVCGHEVWHPTREGATGLHTTHQHIEAARTALKGSE
ncbi:MAG: hypothetical protein ACOY9J_07615 [Pseudomonadota bacterium]